MFAENLRDINSDKIAIPFQGNVSKEKANFYGGLVYALSGIVFILSFVAYYSLDSLRMEIVTIGSYRLNSGCEILSSFTGTVDSLPNNDKVWTQTGVKSKISPYQMSNLTAEYESFYNCNWTGPGELWGLGGCKEFNQFYVDRGYFAFAEDCEAAFADIGFMYGNYTFDNATWGYMGISGMPPQFTSTVVNTDESEEQPGQMLVRGLAANYTTGTKCPMDSSLFNRYVYK